MLPKFFVKNMEKDKFSLLWLCSMLVIFQSVRASKFLSTQSEYECDVAEGKSSKWGHIYVEGGIEEIEFFTSEFSKPFPCSAKEMVLARPLNACTPNLENEEEVKGKFVIALRGACAMYAKVNASAKAGAAGFILVNSDNALFAMSDGNRTREDIDLYNTIPSVMIKRRSGMILEQSLKHRNGKELKGKIVGEHQPDFFITDALTDCGDCTGEKDSPIKRVKGGLLNVTSSQVSSPVSFEFYAAEYGGALDTKNKLQLINMAHSNGCKPFEDAPEYGFQGKALLIDRGECPFTVKLQNAYNAGASAVIFVNSESRPMTLPGSSRENRNPSLPEYNNGTLLPSVMVFNEAGKTIREFFDHSQIVNIQFHASDIDISLVDDLIDMYEIELWPRDSAEREKQYKQILPDVKSFTGEREREARTLYELAEVHFSL